MDERTAGGLIIAAGVAVVLIGVAVSAGLLSWFGRLPGDLRYESDNVKVYVPLVSMLLVSVVVSLALLLFNRLR
jgi:DUF2905 family protein